MAAGVLSGNGRAINSTVTSIASTTFPLWMVTTAIFMFGIVIFCHLVVLALKGWWNLLQSAYGKGAMDKEMEMKEKHDHEQYEDCGHVHLCNLFDNNAYDPIDHPNSPVGQYIPFRMHVYPVNNGSSCPYSPLDGEDTTTPPPGGGPCVFTRSAANAGRRRR